MTEQAKKYLSDMLNAIELAEQFSKDTPDFESYQADLKTKSAVERQLVIWEKPSLNIQKRLRNLH